ncbi:TetR/AcrR family transcriptional regulator [Actinomadura macra]|uniref:TetR/AcrR family transcriptional regulator n=1 Tax=Actinomadura macra TaxID=46164 RepID=UPI00082D5014|nr:TetR/AcrR family transcriptional regulator [Actinomadura macra]
MRPRDKPVEERRADILDAAEKLALERGIDGVTVDQVTAGAGISKGTFYLYFRSKDEVLDALRDRYVAAFVARQDAAAARAGDPVARIEAWVVTGLEDYVGDHRLHDVVFRHREPARGGAPEPVPAEAAEPLPVESLVRLMEEGGFAVPDPAATAIVLFQALHGAADHLIHTGDADLQERVIEEMRRLCRVLLGPPTG